MMILQLTESEHTLLVDLLERVCVHAREEIVHTDDHAYRELLTVQEQRIRAVCEKIRACRLTPRAPDQQEESP